MAHTTIHFIKTLQPHSGAIILALYYYLKFPYVKAMDVRIREPFSKVYRIEKELVTNDMIVFRTGKDWPCYTRIYVKMNWTEFQIRHDHSQVMEEFRIDGKRLYNGRLITEGGLRVDFEGDFYHPKLLQMFEEYRNASGSPIVSRRQYEIDTAW